MFKWLFGGDDWDRRNAQWQAEAERTQAVIDRWKRDGASQDLVDECKRIRERLKNV